MSYTTTTWSDRIVQFPNRYTKTDETVNQVTLSLSPGTITQNGTPVNAGNLNKIEEGIYNAQLMLYMGGM
jgi:hypothetical protein